MQTDKHNGALGHKFDGHEIAPTSDLWANIEAKLDEKNDRRIIAWWWFSGLAAVLALSFGVYQFAYVSGNDMISTLHEKNATIENQTIDEVKAEQDVIDLSSDINKDVLSNNSNKKVEVDQNFDNNLGNQDQYSAEVQTNRSSKKGGLNIASNNTNKNSDGQQGGQSPNITSDNSSGSTQGNDSKLVAINAKGAGLNDQNKLITQPDVDIDLLALTEVNNLSQGFEQAQLDLAMNLDKGKINNGRWELGVNYQYSTTATTIFKKEIDKSVNTVGLVDSVVALEYLEKPTQSNKIKRVSIPVNLNASIGYQINHRFTVRSGVGWQRIVEHNTVAENVNRNSFKIPVILQWNFIDQFRWGLFANVGLNNEFSFIKLDNDNFSYLIADSNEKVPSHEFHYAPSIQLDAGFKYALSNRMNVEVSPSFKYYLRNIEGVKSFYFGGQVGVYWKLN